MELFDLIAIFIMIFAFAVPVLRGLWERRQEKQHPEIVERRKQQAEEAARKEYRQIYTAIYGDEPEEEAPVEVIEEEEPPPPEPQREIFSRMEERQFESPIEERMIEPTTVELDLVDRGEESPPSRAQALLGQLDAPSTMLILHEILDRPRAFDSNIY